MSVTTKKSSVTTAVRPFTVPVASDGSASDAFDVVISSMFYGFCPDTGHN
jgi:hypothetical protein